MSLKDYNEYAKLISKVSQSIANGSVSHAYIIEGDSCANKTEFAKDFVKAILCKNDPGYGCDECVTCRRIGHDNYEDMYYAKSDDLSVKDASISALQESLKNKPTAGERNIAIIENADSMTVRAQNRLLKTLEEPNQGTVIILLSENTENLIQTINSRCITYRLGNFVQQQDNEQLDFARKIITMVLEGAYFDELKNQLTKGVKDRKEAFEFLDAMERIFREYMIADGSGAIKKEKIVVNVKYVEEARRDLLANINYKYAIRNLIIKIGG